ncbi:hypothetical protein VCV18_008183 [Metarhizium anisopliae]
MAALAKKSPPYVRLEDAVSNNPFNTQETKAASVPVSSSNSKTPVYRKDDRDQIKALSKHRPNLFKLHM